MRMFAPALFLMPVTLHAVPGGVVPMALPSFEAQALVEWAAADAAGGVYVLGDFAAADGVARPGLARLQPDGTLDAGFAPAGFSEMSAAVFSADPAESPLFPLAGGKLMVTFAGGWDLLGPDGAGGQPGFADLPRTGGAVLRPAFAADDGRVFVVWNDELRAYRGETLERDPGFSVAAPPRPAFQAAPAAGGMVWVLGRTNSPGFQLFPDDDYCVFRVMPDGAPDPTFAPVELPGETVYALEAATGGGFRLIGEWTGRFRFWPRSEHLPLTVETYDSGGSSLGKVSLALPAGWDRSALGHPAPDRVIQPSLDGSAVELRTAGASLPGPALTDRLSAPEVPVAGPTAIRALTVLPDGAILAGGTRRFLASGVPDPAWHVTRLSRAATISQLVRQPNGSVLVAGDFDRVDGVAAPGAVVLRADGSRDAGFAPAFDFRHARKIAGFPGGGWLAWFGTYARDAVGNGSALVKFDAAGGFVSLWPVPPAAGTPTISYGEVADLAVLADGTALVTTINRSDVTNYFQRRIEPDGSEGFAFATSSASAASTALLVLGDGSYLRGNVRHAADGTRIGAIAGLEDHVPVVEMADGSVIFRRLWGWQMPVLARWHPLRGVDAGFAASLEGNVAGAVAAADGKLLVWGGFSDGASLVRLHANGRRDPTFRAPAGTVRAVEVDSVGSVWAAGDFAEGPLLRLADTRADGFGKWIAAATAGTGWSGGWLDPAADPDGDGVPNFLEYAAGTNPSGADSPASQPSPAGPLQWLLPCNPEAPGLARRVEVSADLIHWQPADSSRVRLENRADGFSWTLLPGHGTLFSRVRID